MILKIYIETIFLKESLDNLKTHELNLNVLNKSYKTIT